MEAQGSVRRTDPSQVAAFTPGRRQDAYATIGGFLYQMQVTLNRWLDLGESECLYLECGEDIDAVRLDDTRLLEQVKVRGSSLTLQSGEALAALAHFAAHLHANPGRDLRYRYTTTASLGRERSSRLGSRSSAIRAWNDARQTPEVAGPTLEILAELLQGASKPQRCNDHEWAQLHAVIRGEGPTPFAEFVRRFEWSAGSEPSGSLKETIRNRLATFEVIGPDATATELRYQQLLFVLLELLSQAGEKRLTRAALLEALERPTLTQADRRRIARLELQASFQSDRIDALSTKVSALDADRFPHILFGAATSDLGEVGQSLALPSPPPLVVRLAKRERVVSDLASLAGARKWVHIHGDYGSGKSHCAALLAERLGGVAVGLDLKDLKAAVVEPALELLVSRPEAAALLKRESSTVVLVDNIPENIPRGRFEDAFVRFLRKVIDAGGIIITTGHRRIAPGIGARVDSVICESVVPPFSDEDVRELLLAHGVVDPPTDLCAQLNRVCGGHPLLLTALIRNFSVAGLDPSAEILTALATRKQWSELDRDTSRAIEATITNASCRRLLYRLAALGYALSESELRRIATLAPAVEDSSICFGLLEGLWLRLDGSGRFAPSPLTAPLARDLPENELRVVHREGARALFGRTMLTPTEFFQGVISLFAANESQLAAMYLVHGCARWNHPTLGYSTLGVHLFFPPDDESLPPPIEIVLRAFQAVAAAEEGLDPGPYLARAVHLAAADEKRHALSAAMAGTVLLSPRKGRPVSIAIEGARLVERSRRGHDLSELSEGGSEDLFEDGEYLLAATINVVSWQDAIKVATLLGEIRDLRGYDICESMGVRSHLFGIVFSAAFDPNGIVRPGARDGLKALEDHCRRITLPLLEAYAIAGQCMVRDGQADVVEAVKELRIGVRHDLLKNPGAAAVIEAAVGQQLVWNGAEEEGLGYLKRALAGPYLQGIERGNRSMDEVVGAWGRDVETAYAAADEVSRLLDSGGITDPEQACQWNAQLAVVRWRQGNRTVALRHFERAVVRLEEMPDTTRMRYLGAGLIHCAIYYDSAARGEPVPMTADGPYAEPRPHMFAGVGEAQAGLWKAKQSPAIVALCVGRLAEALGSPETSFVWMDKAMVAAVKMRAPAVIIQLSGRPIAAALRNREWASAIEAAVSLGRARIFAEAAHKAGVNITDDSLEFDPLEVPSKPEDVALASETGVLALGRALVVVAAPAVVAGHRIEGSDELSALLRRVGSGHGESREWQECADILEAASEQDLRREARDRLLLLKHNTSELMAHALLGLRADTPLEQAAASQCGALWRQVAMQKFLGLDLGAYADAVHAYWLSALQRARFRFGGPGNVQRALEEASRMKGVVGAKHVLKAVVGSLGVMLPPDARSWLEDGQD